MMVRGGASPKKAVALGTPGNVEGQRQGVPGLRRESRPAPPPPPHPLGGVVGVRSGRSPPPDHRHRIQDVEGRQGHGHLAAGPPAATGCTGTSSGENPIQRHPERPWVPAGMAREKRPLLVLWFPSDSPGSKAGRGHGRGGGPPPGLPHRPGEDGVPVPGQPGSRRPTRQGGSTRANRESRYLDHSTYVGTQVLGVRVLLRHKGRSGTLGKNERRGWIGPGFPGTGSHSPDPGVDSWGLRRRPSGPAPR